MASFKPFRVLFELASQPECKALPRMRRLTHAQSEQLAVAGVRVAAAVLAAMPDACADLVARERAEQ